MSKITLDTVKAFIQVTHDSDNARLQRMLDGAEDEALRYLELDTLPRLGAACPDCEPTSGVEPVSDADDVAPVVVTGICILVQAVYDAGTAAEVKEMRRIAFDMLSPYRCGMGV